jgi:hypothetical protein
MERENVERDFGGGGSYHKDIAVTILGDVGQGINLS